MRRKIIPLTVIVALIGGALIMWLTRAPTTQQSSDVASQKAVTAQSTNQEQPQIKPLTPQPNRKWPALLTLIVLVPIGIFVTIARVRTARERDESESRRDGISDSSSGGTTTPPAPKPVREWPKIFKTAGSVLLTLCFCGLLVTGAYWIVRWANNPSTTQDPPLARILAPVGGVSHESFRASPKETYIINPDVGKVRIHTASGKTWTVTQGQINPTSVPLYQTKEDSKLDLTWYFESLNPGPVWVNVE